MVKTPLVCVCRLALCRRTRSSTTTATPRLRTSAHSRHRDRIDRANKSRNPTPLKQHHHHTPTPAAAQNHPAMANLVAVDVSVTDDRIHLVFSHRGVAQAYAKHLQLTDRRAQDTIPGYRRDVHFNAVTNEVTLTL